MGKPALHWFVLSRVVDSGGAVEMKTVEASPVIGPQIARVAGSLGFELVFEFDRKPVADALAKAATHEDGAAISGLPGMVRLWMVPR